MRSSGKERGKTWIPALCGLGRGALESRRNGSGEALRSWDRIPPPMEVLPAPPGWVNRFIATPRSLANRSHRIEHDETRNVISVFSRYATAMLDFLNQGAYSSDISSMRLSYILVPLPKHRYDSRDRRNFSCQHALTSSSPENQPFKTKMS
jgi:hypothetical protein